MSLPCKQLAIGYFEDYLELIEYCKKLKAQKKSVSLPLFFNPSLGRLQAEYDDLKEEYRKVLRVNDSLSHKVKDLIELASALSNENAPIPSFLKKAVDV